MLRRYVTTRLGQLHTVSEGSGRPLLLIGSAGRSASIFDRLIPLLSPRRKVIAADLFGTGNSALLPNDATIETLAAAMTDLLDEYNIDQADVYGFHTGNKIGTALAALYAKRVDHLILCGQSHSIIPSRDERNSVIGGRVREYFNAPTADDTSLRVHAWAELQRRVMALWWPDAAFDPAGDRAVALADARQRVIDELLSFDSTATLYRINFEYDLAAHLPRIKARTLIVEVVTPDEDRLLGRRGAQMQALIPGSELVVLEDDGFRLTLENRAADLARIIDGFLG